MDFSMSPWISTGVHKKYCSIKELSCNDMNISQYRVHFAGWGQENERWITGHDSRTGRQRSNGRLLESYCLVNFFDFVCGSFSPCGFSTRTNSTERWSLSDTYLSSHFYSPSRSLTVYLLRAVLDFTGWRGCKDAPFGLFIRDPPLWGGSPDRYQYLLPLLFSSYVSTHRSCSLRVGSSVSIHSSSSLSCRQD